ncbi:aminotransferase class V-fold PLP-dependent enzyme [Nocardioides zeae]|uniref:Kynureninase n=1 Tax=Nocardioides imazamoxiresistens TaxID=3231893 RepID=A0ABU3PRH0_9ACTN|nr:aminotransferase class V-fold PLP-dependent enzyme [Nocardioides zeae]MDT9591791.1 aminotransferase class V-fold PLP-dependent enzyme [Nocardioides zeae]
MTHRDPAGLDREDPLGPLRERFVGAGTDLVYLDGNSLGRPLAATAARMAAFVEQDWGTRLIRGWDEGWFDLPLTLGDELGRVVLGAGPGQTAVGDSTTVLLYKMLRALVAEARDRDPARVEIVVDTDNFPTDRYVVEGVAAETGAVVRWLEVPTDGGIEVEALTGVLGPTTAVVLASHVAYRSGHLLDLAALTAAAHAAGATVLADLCHSAGAVEVRLDAADVDVAVGCTYKYLNGGPGSPAYVYVARRLQERLRQPITGWMGHADPFAMGPGHTPATGMRRFLSGTPAVLAMQPLAATVALLDEVGVAAVREKSVGLTGYAVELADDLLAPLGVELATPRDPARRGGHVTLRHPAMREVVAALWRRDVLPDYRDPDGLRVGLAPLSTSYAEVRAGLVAVRDELVRVGQAGEA